MNLARTLPKAFTARLAGVYGPAKASAWLSVLDERLGRLCERFGVDIEGPLPLSYNLVLAARRGDERLVLKLSPGEAILDEIETMTLCSGTRYARVLEDAPDELAYLMERITPGRTLASSDLSDDDATRVIASFAKGAIEAPEQTRIRRAEEVFEGLARHRRRFGGSGPIPTALFERAERESAQLLEDDRPRHVLHGDLHHGNVLSSSGDREGWRLIDPHGVIAEPCYELGAWMRNPPGFTTREDLKVRVARRLDVVCEATGFDRERVRAWCACQAVLSMAWSIEDGEDGWETNLSLIEALDAA